MPQRPSAALATLALIALSAVPMRVAIAAVGDAYVTSDASNQTRMYTGPTGVYQAVFTPSSAATGELGIHFGATNNRVLIGHFGGGVEEFNATSGAYIKTYSPGGGTQWAGLYAPTGGVYIGSWNTQDVREYDATTGAFIRVLTTVTDPADMRLHGNKLYIASYGGGQVKIVHAVTGAFMGLIVTPPRPNDIAILPSGEILVTCMGYANVVRYSPVFAPLGSFAPPGGWVNPHGIEISPHDGNIYVVEGGAGQVHVFDPVTFTELTPTWLSPAPGDKVVDIEFRPDNGPTPALPSSWGALKRIYR